MGEFSITPSGFPVDVSRPTISNPDGSFSTERTITIGPDLGDGQKAYSIPTIVGGQQLSPREAEAAFYSGQNPPVGFSTRFQRPWPPLRLARLRLARSGLS
jgi:hypothetical protein